MAEQKDLVLVGGGGHCRSCIDVIEMHGGWRIAAILDRREKIGEAVLNHAITGSDEDIARWAGQGAAFLVTAGQIKNVETRIKLYDAIRSVNGRLATIVSPRAHVSPHARVGDGTIVMHGAIVNAGAVVGNNVIVNTMALIEHDAAVGDHCHVSTAAIVNGGVSVGARCFIGSNAVLHQYTSVPGGTVMAAGTIYRKAE